jgi:hypothetical protein
VPILTNTKVQIGKESTWGTAVAATKIVPVSADPTFGVEYAAVRDSGRRGIAAMDFFLLQGGGRSNIGLEGPLLPDIAGNILAGIMGTVSTGAAVSGVYPHTITLGSSVPSLTVEDANPVAYREVPGAQVSEVRLSFAAADGLLSHSTSLVGLQPVSGGTATASLTAETNKPWIGIDTSVSIGGTTTNRVTSAEITLSRAQEVVHTTGSRDPSRIDAQPLEVTFSLSLDAGTTSVDDLAKYIGTSGAFTESALVMTWTYGSTSTLRSLVFTATSASYGDGPATRDLGNGLYQITLNGRCLYNTTDSGPCKFVLNNTQTSY